jgi:glycosyltransferase involved in cell wall biosynthesis
MNPPLHLVAVILTQNEARHIAACIASVRPWVDAVVIWDGGSADETVAMARQAGALTVYRPFDNFSAQRQAVLDTLHATWILFVDADERVTPALAQEIKMLAAQAKANGYWIPRRNYIAGHEMRGGGFFPDYQLRLLRRHTAHYDLRREVHEFAEVEGVTGQVIEPLVHFNYDNWEHFHRKQRVYAEFEARILAQRAVHPRLHNFILQPLREFQRRFFKLGGWQDGLAGVRLALWLAWYYGFMPYWLLLRRRVR